jgi:signal transduction histidine kinase
MASAATDGLTAPARHGRWRRLATPRVLLTVWLPILAISAGHFLTDPGLEWVHDVLRRVYYLPIVLAAFQVGLAGALAAVILVVGTYYPHAFVHLHHMDPASGLEKALEIVLYVVVALVAGHLSDLERRRREELERALEEQKRLRDQLVRAGRLGALGEVVAGIAHEIKNPLHALAGTAEIVDPLIPREADERRLWDIHVSEIQRLERTAERFLSFARPGAAQRVRLDLRDVARRLNDLVAAQARQQGVALELALPPEPAWTQADQDQLAQVGLNIAVNALKAIAGAGRAGGRVRILVGNEIRGEQPMRALVIENDGPPIPEGELERLFDPFTGSAGGTGLGLAISARIAEQHEGYIEAANAGLGVTFRVLLPAAE